MKHTFLLLSLMLFIAFSSAQASTACTDVKISPILKHLQNTDSNKTEVIFYNPEYCYSNFTDISLSDSENFKLDVNYGEVPCGSLTPSTRGYEFCTVGIEFTPVTTSGDFTTEIQATQQSGTFSSTITAEASCGHHHKSHGLLSKLKNKLHKSCGCKSYGHKSHGLLSKLKNKFHGSCGSNNAQPTNYLAGLNLVAPTCSSNVYVDNGTLIFNDYNSQGAEGIAVIQLDKVANSSTKLTFDANITGGLVMPIMYSDTDSFMTTDVKITKRYGFIFPNNALEELKLKTWGQSVSGSFSNMSLVDYVNPDLLP